MSKHQRAKILTTDGCRALTLDEITSVSGAKGDSGALDAAKKIDMTAYLKLVDAALAKLKSM